MCRQDRNTATNSFLAQGGDPYSTFLEAKTLADTQTLLSDLVMDYVRETKRVDAPRMGRLVPASPARD